MKVMGRRLSVVTETVFCFALSAMLFVFFVSAEAQQAKKVPRIGLLSVFPQKDAAMLVYEQWIKDEITSREYYLKDEASS